MKPTSAAISPRARRPHIALLFGALIVSFLVAQKVNACSCGPAPTVLESYAGSDTVVIARVVSLEKARKAEKLGDPGYMNGVKLTTMLVEKVFKGTTKVGEKLIFGQGGGADCIWTFREEDMGEQFLFYLHSRADLPKWYASTCGRSRRVEFATDDLLYLNDLEKLRDKTRISGTLTF